MTQLLTRAEVQRMVTLGTSTIYRKMAAGEFPKPISLGGAVRWKAEEIEEWIDTRTRPEYRKSAA